MNPIPRGHGPLDSQSQAKNPQTTGNDENEENCDAQGLPVIPNLIHKKPLQPKVPPHMRRLNMRVTSPSDNLSPMSQKLMAADRHNQALKTVRPRSLKEALLSSKLSNHGTSDRLASTTRKGDASETEEDPGHLVADGMEIAMDEDDSPPSPTKASKHSATQQSRH